MFYVEEGLRAGRWDTGRLNFIGKVSLKLTFVASQLLP